MPQSYFFIGILLHENLGLDTKVTFLLQPEQKLFRHQSHLFIATRTEVMTHLPK